MKLTDFKRTKQGRIALFVDGEFAFSVRPELFAVSGLCAGCELSEDALEELRAEAELKAAKEKALTLLSHKEYTSHELAERLRRQVDGQAAGRAVERMEELGLVDDEDYAVRFARDLLERKKYGALRVRQEMRRRGLPDELVEYAVGLVEDDPVEKARALLIQKYPMAWEDEKVRRRAFAALQRRGYRGADIRAALRLDDPFD